MVFMERSGPSKGNYQGRWEVRNTDADGVERGGVIMVMRRGQRVGELVAVGKLWRADVGGRPAGLRGKRLIINDDSSVWKRAVRCIIRVKDSRARLSDKGG